MRVTITYIGGGSKDWAHKYFSDILSQDKLNGELRLYDINLVAAEKNRLYFNKLKADNIENIKCDFVCKVYSDIDEALTGADFVLISILPQSLENMYVDVHYPEKYGIFQSVGDTVGPGGYIRALRTLPFYKFFAEKIKKNCKDAWVINYTNPMTLCMNALYRAFPEIKAFGCCHEVFGTQTLMANIVSMYNLLSDEGKSAFIGGKLREVKNELKDKGYNFDKLKSFKDIKRSEIKVNVQGINHFTWINRAEYNREDIMPIFSAYIKLFRQNNRLRNKWYTPRIIKQHRNENKVKYDLFEQYGVSGAAGDRHLAEFIPNVYLLKGGRVRPEDGFFLTPVRGRIMFDKYKAVKLNRAIKTKKKLLIKISKEEGVSQITALCGLQDLVTNVNVINKGQQKDLVMGTAVETNAKFSKDKIEPVDAGKIEPEVSKLINVHANNQKDFINAYFNNDKEGIINVFLNDPAVKRIGEDKGRQLFSEMIELSRDCVEEFIK